MRLVLKIKPVMRNLLTLGLLTAAASACENPFGFSYIAETIKPGRIEIEQYITTRLGRDVGNGYEARYRGLDFKTEIELGLSDHEQINLELTQLYVESSVRDGLRFNGVNVAYKRMLADPDKADWGRAVYLEAAYSQVSSKTGAFRDRYGLEAKYIFQHNFGDNSGWMYIGNLVGEVTHTSGTGEDAFEWKLTQGIARELNAEWTLGLEAVGVAEWAELNNFESAALFLGPTLNFRRGDFAVTLAGLAQVVGSPKEKGDLNVSEHSPYQVRLLMSLEF
jgi:hypothetical protein